MTRPTANGVSARLTTTKRCVGDQVVRKKPKTDAARSRAEDLVTDRGQPLALLPAERLRQRVESYLESNLE
jgi:hypothetical protein